MSAKTVQMDADAYRHAIARAKAEGAAEEREACIRDIQEALRKGEINFAYAVVPLLRARGPNVAPKDEAREKALEVLREIEVCVSYCTHCRVDKMLVDEAIALLSGTPPASPPKP